MNLYQIYFKMLSFLHENKRMVLSVYNIFNDFVIKICYVIHFKAMVHMKFVGR